VLLARVALVGALVDAHDVRVQAVAKRAFVDELGLSLVAVHDTLFELFKLSYWVQLKVR